MQRLIICGAILLALLFPPIAEGHICRPSEKIDGDNGRHQSQIRLAKERGLPFFETASTIRRIVEQGEGHLVHVPNEGVGFRVRGIGINPVPKNPPKGCEHYPKGSRSWLYYVHPETLAYLELLSADFEAAFPGRFIKITGLSRTIEGQKLLRACYATAHSLSPHQWGITFDIGWRNLSHHERCWILDRLETDQDKGYTIVVDEITWGKHLHVTVHPDWLQLRVYELYPITALGFTVDFH